MAERIRRHIVFYGSVQGVGFRYRAYYAARNNGVSGWVRNRFDGAVEAELEGEERSIDRMIMDIERGTFVRIENMECKSVPVRNEYSFEIKD
ncbi:MAG: acylphosphatase [Ruminococcus sp.]|nr:acylphosphatase [Ruminococcus sp.]